MLGRRFLSVLLVPVYTRYMSRSDYGIMDLLDTTLILVTLLFGLRRAESILFFYKQASNEAERKRAVATATLVSIAIGVLVAGIALLLAPVAANLLLGKGDYTRYVVLSFLNFFFVFPVEVGLAVLRAQGLAKTYTSWQLTRMLSAAGVNIALLVFTPLRVEAFLIASLVSSVLVSVSLTVRSLRWSGVHFDTGLLVRDVRYGIPLAVHGVAMLAIHYGDRYFLRAAASLADVGLYSLAYKMGMMVGYAHTSFDLYWRTQVFDVLKRADGREQYTRMVTYLAAAMVSCLVLLTVFVEPILRLMAGPQFQGAAPYVPVIAAAYVLRALGDQLRIILRVRDQNWREARLTLISAGSCLALYALMVPPLKIWGAAWATLGTFLLMLILSFQNAQSVERFSFEYSRLAKLLAAAAAACGPVLLWRPAGLLVQIPAGMALTAVYVGLLWAMKFPTPEEMKAIRRNTRQLAQRLGAAAA